VDTHYSLTSHFNVINRNCFWKIKKNTKEIEIKNVDTHTRQCCVPASNDNDIDIFYS